jgi:uncharacterized protein YfbU (UPF0304 family)
LLQGHGWRKRNNSAPKRLGSVNSKHLAAVLIAWIQRNDNKVVDVKKMTFKGYAAQDLEHILNAQRSRDEEDRKKSGFNKI